jgi:hypothetical protein
MKEVIQQNAFINFITGLSGMLVKTSARRRQFQVNVLEGNLIFTPLSSGKSRKEPSNNLTKLIAHFNTTKSLAPKDYHELTFNSVYFITLIEMYLKSLSE